MEKKSDCNDCDKDFTGLVSEIYDLFLQFSEPNHLFSVLSGYVKKLLTYPIKDNTQVEEIMNFVERVKFHNIKFN